MLVQLSKHQKEMSGSEADVQSRCMRTFSFEVVLPKNSRVDSSRFGDVALSARDHSRATMAETGGAGQHGVYTINSPVVGCWLAFFFVCYILIFNPLLDNSVVCYILLFAYWLGKPVGWQPGQDWAKNKNIVVVTSVYTRRPALRRRLCQVWTR